MRGKASGVRLRARRRAAAARRAAPAAGLEEEAVLVAARAEAGPELDPRGAQLVGDGGAC